MKNYLFIALILFFVTSCTLTHKEPTSSSGVTKATVEVQTDENGNTVEQLNVMKRLLVDNAPGSIKHLYVISPYSGQVLIYSTVKGKVTSGNKRLTPTTVEGTSSSLGYLFTVKIGNDNFYTKEVLGDDGTYGSSGEYLFWFDARGVFHQQYTQGCMIHVSDQPLVVKNVVINMELTNKE